MTSNIENARIFVVSELFYPEETSTGYFVTRIAEGMARDARVTAICSKPTYSERSVEVLARETHNDVEILRVRSTRLNKDNLFGRLINLVTFTISAAVCFGLRVRRGDTVLCLTNPPPLPMFVGLVAKLKGVRALLLVHDLYPEVLGVTGFLSERGLLYRALYHLFSWTYQLYDEVIVLGRDMQALVSKKLTDQQVPVVIPNWGDVAAVHPLPRSENPFAIEHGLNDKTVIQFSGNLGRTHDLESVIRVANQFLHDPAICFLFVGYGGKAHLLGDLVGRNQPSNLVFLPRQPREMLGPMLACADATIIAFMDGMLGVSVPSRMYNVMAAGVPIIALCHHQSELALTVEELNCGWLLSVGDEAGLAELVRQIHSSKNSAGPSEAERRGENGRAGAQKFYSEAMVVDQFRKLVGNA